MYIKKSLLNRSSSKESDHQTSWNFIHLISNILIFLLNTMLNDHNYTNLKGIHRTSLSSHRRVNIKETCTYFFFWLIRLTIRSCVKMPKIVILLTNVHFMHNSFTFNSRIFSYHSEIKVSYEFPSPTMAPANVTEISGFLKWQSRSRIGNSRISKSVEVSYWM